MSVRYESNRVSVQERDEILKEGGRDTEPFNGLGAQVKEVHIPFLRVTGEGSLEHSSSTLLRTLRVRLGDET